MDFSEKLRELRKKKGLTQDELADAIYVSRTAISKWESGRGYPNIDSLKNIAQFFGVSVDELLSSTQVLTIAEEDYKQKQAFFTDLVFGFFDLSSIALLFLPFFAQKSQNTVLSVSLLSLTDISLYLKIAYFVIVICLVLLGVAFLAFQNLQYSLWRKIKNKISLSLACIATLIFIISLQPYAAVFLFIFLVIKAFLLLKHR